MIDLVGYLALSLALIAMTNKKILNLRIMHLISCFFYIIYGTLAGALPVAIGALLFSSIHFYHLHKLLRKKGE